MTPEEIERANREYRESMVSMWSLRSLRSRHLAWISVHDDCKMYFSGNIKAGQIFSVPPDRVPDLLTFLTP